MYRLAPISSRIQFHELLKARRLHGVGVEVGTHRGEYALAVLRHWRCAGFVCVDPWAAQPGYDEQAALLRGLGGDGDREADYRHAAKVLRPWGATVRLFRGTSAQAAAEVGGQLDFVYVDGDHRFEHVLADLRIWWPKVTPGGLLAGHDWIQPGETHRWADEIQRAVTLFAEEAGIADVQLVVEEGGLPWSYYMEKPR